MRRFLEQSARSPSYESPESPLKIPRHLYSLSPATHRGTAPVNVSPWPDAREFCMSAGIFAPTVARPAPDRRAPYRLDLWDLQASCLKIWGEPCRGRSNDCHIHRHNHSEVCTDCTIVGYLVCFSHVCVCVWTAVGNNGYSTGTTQALSLHGRTYMYPQNGRIFLKITPPPHYWPIKWTWFQPDKTP